MLQSFAPAKVNLHLHVIGKRADGYHLLDSLAVFPNVGDMISVEPADTLSLIITGRFGKTLAAETDNLVLRAARALSPTGTGAITLEKNLPVASGIGGGSADAAAALRVLSHHWGLYRPLHGIATALGADVPVCLARSSARMSGIGDILTPAPKLPNFGIILVNPGVHVATPAVFRARAAAFTPPAAFPAGWSTPEALVEALSHTSNDLEPPAISLAPVIGDVLAHLKSLPGCRLARMSGSGATCFAIFATPAAATTAATNICQPNWWHWAGGLYEPAPTDI
ncbi:MAG: 4-(cytidine 5'-diphospho)-2-C-methyl-D-erythritol kinase [Acidocella sp.]|nr:4-(cytidine 5'-diphospho)-2-C-methyl-D-erythritol kinase [Acidocella sp.]